MHKHIGPHDTYIGSKLSLFEKTNADPFKKATPTYLHK